MKALIATSVLAFTLVGCSTTTPMPSKPTTSSTHQAHGQHTAQHHHTHNTVQTFVCENDATPIIRSLSDTQIEFSSPKGDATPTVMTLAPAASGERYVSKTGIYGKGGEWHQKGNMAVFTYHGYGSPTNCQAR